MLGPLTDSGRAAHRIFLLSPARCSGERAQLLVSPRADFPLARQLRSREGAPLADVFTFLSGLYFRGKLAYARAFAAPPPGAGDGVFVITPHAGLRPADLPVRRATLAAAARVDIRVDNSRYRRPLARTAHALAGIVGEACEVVLLGSVASDKYVTILGEVFSGCLLFPVDFVGRGDMSRGGLLLRCVTARRELAYAPALGGVRHGARPPRLAPLR